MDSNESSGNKFVQNFFSIIFSGFIISGCSFILDNKLVSFGNEKRFEIDKEYVKRKSRHKVKDNLKNIFLQKIIQHMLR